MKFPEVIDYAAYLEDEAVLAFAKMMESKNTYDGRDRNRRYANAQNGKALEIAVINWIEENYPGCVKINPDSKDLTFDAMLFLKNKWVPFDVKGMFSDNAKYYSQSKWEHEHANKNTVYGCWDCRTGIGKLSGIAPLDSWQESQFPKNGVFDFYLSPRACSINVL